MDCKKIKEIQIIKVLSLTEPFATLIKENMKLIETRSWKTSYRGEFYIHASVTEIAKHDKYVINNDISDSKVKHM